MNNFMLVLCTILSVAAFAVSVIKFTHFFQLNSYRAILQLKWIKNNPGKVLSNLAFGAMGIIVSLAGSLWAMILYAVIMLFGVITSIPGKAKKPLVYTMRVKRLLAATFVLYVVSVCIGAYSNTLLLMCAIAFLLCPMWILLSNIINRPVENAISNHYINDAKRMLSSSNAKVIGITGSYGKTSVKYYLSTLLKAKYNVLMTPESYNTPMGVVKTIRSSLSALNEIFVCEMGAKRVGEIKEICDIVNPDMGIITSVGPQHLETFKSLDNIKKTKFELADSLPWNGLLFLNGDDENIKAFKGNRKCITYSVEGNGDYNGEVISVTEKGTAFTVKAPSGEECTFATSLIGKHNVLNITGAIAVANTMGIELSMLKHQVQKLKSVPHRLELIPRGNDIIIDDAYNSNPSGTKAALETLACFEGVKILLTPGMVELGAKQDELNCEFGKNAAKVCDYAILVGKSQTQSIYDGLISQNFPKDKIYVASDLNDAIGYAYGLNTKGVRKIILLENDLPDNY